MGAAEKEPRGHLTPARNRRPRMILGARRRSCSKSPSIVARRWLTAGFKGTTINRPQPSRFGVTGPPHPQVLAQSVDFSNTRPFPRADRHHSTRSARIECSISVLSGTFGRISRQVRAYAETRSRLISV